MLIKINGKVFETSYEVLVGKSGFIRTLFDDGNLEPSEEDGIYDLGEISIATKYIEHLIDYINTGNLDFEDLENLTFLENMESTCAYFDVNIDPEEVYFFHNIRRKKVGYGETVPQPVVRMYNIDTYSPRGKVPDFDYASTMVGGISIKENIFIVYELDSKLRVAKYSTFEKKWTYDLKNKNSPPNMTKVAGVVVAGTDIYVIDGVKTNMYDTVMDEWYKYAAPINGSITLSGALCVVHDDIFFFSTNSRQRKVLKFNTKGKTWTQLDTKFPPQSGESACLMKDGLVYIFGKNIYCFNPVTEKMDMHDLDLMEIQGLDLPGGYRGTFFGNVFVHHQRLYVTDRTNEIQKYNSDSESWEFPMKFHSGMLGIVVKGRDQIPRGDPGFFTVKKNLKISSPDLVEEFNRVMLE
jgi:hypothetical protein